MTGTIKRVKVFETEDGQRHDTFAAAQSHNRRTAAYKELANLINSSEQSSFASDIHDFITDNKDVLADILRRLKS